MKAIEAIFRRIHRKDFLPDGSKHLAKIDAPVHIGYEQSNSQPSVVKQMLLWLGAEKDERVLEIGSGSGWVAALLSEMVGGKGRVLATEIIPQLRAMSEANCAKIGRKNITFFLAGKQLGLPEFAPFDRILVSAAAKTLPKKLLAQLKPGGKMVIPIKSDILEITKGIDGENTIIAHNDFVFVPLVTGPED